MAAESARSARYDRPATVVLAEIIGLDQLAALWGDDVAARAISVVAKVLRSSCRGSDYVVRLGPTRFGILLTETDEVAAINVVERARERCERQLGAAEAAYVAFGWAGASNAVTLLAAADRADGRLRQERESR
jgi:diguanylate cyclase (GGDEF)-like protein